MQLFTGIKQESLKIRAEKEANFLHVSELLYCFSLSFQEWLQQIVGLCCLAEALM